MESQKFYVELLKNDLPVQAFRKARYKVYIILIHFSIITSSIFLIKNCSQNILICLFSVLITGHSLACLGFLAHELSHNSIINNSRLKYFLEIISWGINLIPATMWHRVHNLTHHNHMNTLKDPDRQFMLNEKNISTLIYTKIFYPTHKSSKLNFFIGFHFVPYIIRNIASVFFSDERKPVVVPSKPKFSDSEKRKISFEIICILCIQISIFIYLNSFFLYLIGYIFPILIASTILMLYIFTNHFSNPIIEKPDPLLTTTSVKVPKIFDILHHNFSYHTEHHIFPSMNSDYYPDLSRLLQKKFPDRYNSYPILEVWEKLWKNNEFEDLSKITTQADKSVNSL